MNLGAFLGVYADKQERVARFTHRSAPLSRLRSLSRRRVAKMSSRPEWVRSVKAFFRRGVFLSPFHILRADALVVRPVDYKRGRDTGKPLLSKLLAHLAYRSVGVQPEPS